jgi:hypothetical protein
VFVEAESKKVGNLAVPDELMVAMRASPCLNLQLDDEERVALLLEVTSRSANSNEIKQFKMMLKIYHNDN